jgi:hypothetical protein
VPLRPVSRIRRAGGPGFWELDLLNGTAWFSPWIHAVLGGPKDGRPGSWSDWRPLISAADWSRLLNALRTVLECNGDLDLEFELEIPALGRRTWRLQGCLDRGSTHLPVQLSGSLCDVTDARPAAPAATNAASGAAPAQLPDPAIRPRPPLRGIKSQ